MLQHITFSALLMLCLTFTACDSTARLDQANTKESAPTETAKKSTDLEAAAEPSAKKVKVLPDAIDSVMDNAMPKAMPKAMQNTENNSMNKEQQIEVAMTDLESRLEIDRDEIKLAGYEAVIWRSGAIGCPKKGNMYTMALTPGHLMMFVANDVAYRYHASANGVPFYCPTSRAESPAPGEGDI